MQQRGRITEEEPSLVDRKKTDLTLREIEVLSLLANGMRTDQIAHRIGLARGTVEFHIRNARVKLQAHTREQAIARAIVTGKIFLDDAEDGDTIA